MLIKAFQKKHHKKKFKRANTAKKNHLAVFEKVM